MGGADGLGGFNADLLRQGAAPANAPFAAARQSGYSAIWGR